VIPAALVVAALIAASIADGLTTIVAIGRGATEANGLARFAIEVGGVPFLAVLKLAPVVAFALAIAWSSSRMTWVRVGAGVATLTVVAAAWNLAQ
jgi:hypothetical protein